jgi:hypothetical protein
LKDNSPTAPVASLAPSSAKSEFETVKVISSNVPLTVGVIPVLTEPKNVALASVKSALTRSVNTPVSVTSATIFGKAATKLSLFCKVNLSRSLLTSEPV